MGEAKQVDLTGKVVGEIELPRLDVQQYVGKKVRIDAVTEMEGQFGNFIKVETAPVDTRKDILDDEGNALVLKASRVFGLQTDKDGRIGWGKETKLGLFLKKMGVNHYKKLVGLNVVVQTQTSKDGKEYLTF